MTSGAIQYGVPLTECMLLAKSCRQVMSCCVTLHHAASHCVALHHIVSCCVTLHRVTVSHRVMLYHCVTPCHVVSHYHTCHTASHHVTLHHTISLHHRITHYLAILCTAKVYQFDHTPGVDHDICPLDVTVDDSIIMEITEGTGDLSGVMGNCGPIQCPKPVQQGQRSSNHLVMCQSHVNHMPITCLLMMLWSEPPDMYCMKM